MGHFKRVGWHYIALWRKLSLIDNDFRRPEDRKSLDFSLNCGSWVSLSSVADRQLIDSWAAITLRKLALSDLGTPKGNLGSSLIFSLSTLSTSRHRGLPAATAPA